MERIHFTVLKWCCGNEDQRMKDQMKNTQRLVECEPWIQTSWHPFTNWTMHLSQRKDKIHSFTMMYKSPQKTGNNGKEKESKPKDTTRLLARNYDKEQVIPSWAAFLVNSRTITSGMLPIIQAAADDNSTIATVTNRFMDITSKLGQLYTIIAMDQPLYSRAKKLVWANQNSYKDVVLTSEMYSYLLT